MGFLRTPADRADPFHLNTDGDSGHREDDTEQACQRHALVAQHHGTGSGHFRIQRRRIWRSHGLKPHRVTSFKVSNDPLFADKLEAIVGLYLNPPEHALVLSVDEKSQIQALDRTQPGLPMKKAEAPP